MRCLTWALTLLITLGSSAGAAVAGIGEVANSARGLQDFGTSVQTAQHGLASNSRQRVKRNAEFGNSKGFVEGASDSSRVRRAAAKSTNTHRKSAGAAKSLAGANSGESAGILAGLTHGRGSRSSGHSAESGKFAGRGSIKSRELASSKEMVHAARAALAKLAAPGAPPGPSPYSADCYYKGLLKKHEEVWITDRCHSHCECNNGESECEERKCSDNYKQPAPTDYIKEERKRKLKRQKKLEEEERKKNLAREKKEEEKRRKEEERRKKEEEKYNKDKNKKPSKPKPKYPTFHHDYVPDESRPSVHPYPGHHSPAYPAFQFPPNFFNIATDNGIYSGSIQDSFRDIFRPIFSSGAGADILRRTNQISSAHRHFGSGYGSGYAGSHSGMQGSQRKNAQDQVYGTEYKKGHKYDRGYHKEQHYGTAFSDYGSYGTSSQGSHNYHGSYGTGSQGSHSYYHNQGHGGH